MPRGGVQGGVPGGVPIAADGGRALARHIGSICAWIGDVNISVAAGEFGELGDAGVRFVGVFSKLNAID
jgi:hypothetical protein